MHCRPPKDFRPVGEGGDRIEWVSFEKNPPPFIKPKVRKGRRKQGVLYEQKVHERLREEVLRQGFGNYFSGQWIRFKEEEDRPRWCQIDGLLVSPTTSTITIFEVKYQHTARAWWQLRRLYLPVLAARARLNRSNPPWRFEVCEVVKWYDPAVLFPEDVTLVRDPFNIPRGKFGVHILTP